jgi:hypothetical protein
VTATFFALGGKRMREATTEEKITLADLFASLPRWARIVTLAVFVAECVLLGAGLLSAPAGDTGTVRVDLSRAGPAPGFSSL